MCAMMEKLRVNSMDMMLPYSSNVSALCAARVTQPSSRSRPEHDRCTVFTGCGVNARSSTGEEIRHSWQRASGDIEQEAGTAALNAWGACRRGRPDQFYFL